MEKNRDGIKACETKNIYIEVWQSSTSFFEVPSFTHLIAAKFTKFRICVNLTLLEFTTIKFFYLLSNSALFVYKGKLEI